MSSVLISGDILKVTVLIWWDLWPNLGKAVKDTDLIGSISGSFRLFKDYVLDHSEIRNVALTNASPKRTKIVRLGKTYNHLSAGSR